MIKFKDINNNAHLAVADIKRKHSVNGEKSLSGTIYSGDDVLNNIDTGWGLEFDNEPYVITYYEHHDTDNTISFDAIHKFFWDFSKKMFYRKFNGSNTIDTYLGNIFDGTGYKYALNFKPSAISKENFGMTSRMSMFNDIITSIGAEFEVNGTLVSIYQKIGTDLSTIVRHGFNLSDMAIQNDISGFATYAEGFGVHAKPDDENSPRLHVVYESPLAKTYGRIEAEPIDDERYTVEANLLSDLQAKVDNTLPVSISLSLYDLNKSGYPYKMAKVGDWITAVDEKINFKQKIRIISVDDEFSSDGTRISYAVTAGDISSVQRYQEANASISSRINNAINSADQANQAAISAQVTADGKNTSYRVNSVDELPKNANEGDQGWVQSGDGLVLYIYTKRPDGSYFWDKRIDPEMGQQIAEGVNNAVNQAKTYTDGVKSKVESDISQASQNANDALIDAKTNLSNDIKSAKDLANNAQASANKANTDLVQTKKDLANTVGDLTSTKTDLNAKLNDKASVSYVDTANGQLNAQLVTQGKSIAAINLNSDKLAISLANTQGDVSKLSQTANTLTAGLNDANGNIATLQGKANEFDLTVAKVNDLVNINLLTNSQLNNNMYGWHLIPNSTDTMPKTVWDVGSDLGTQSGEQFIHHKPTSQDTWYSDSIQSVNNNNFSASIQFSGSFEGKNPKDIAFSLNIFSIDYKNKVIGAGTTDVTWAQVTHSFNTVTVEGWITPPYTSYVCFGLTWGVNADIYLARPTLSRTSKSISYRPGGNLINAIASLKVQDDSITSKVSSQDGRITTAQQTADGAKTQVQGLNGRMTTVETTANSASALINDPQKGLNALIAKADENSATIQSTKGDVSSLQQRADKFDFTVAKVNNDSYSNPNLLSDSGFESGDNHGWGQVYDLGQALAHGYPQPSGQYAAVLFSNGNPEFYQLRHLDTPFTVGANQTFTVSYDYSAAGDAPRASDFLVLADGTQTPMLGQTSHDLSNQAGWKRVSYIFSYARQVTITDLRFGLQSDNVGAAWKAIDNIKIEFGNKATPWFNQGGDLASIQVKTDSITNFVKDSDGNLASDFMSALLRTSLMKGVDGGSSLMSQTKNTITDAINDNNANIISYINLDESGVQIGGDKVILDGDTTVTGDFFAKGAFFQNINADNINAGTIDANRIRVVNIDVNSISGDVSNFIQSNWNGQYASVSIDYSGMTVSTSQMTTFFNEKGINLQLANERVGIIGANTMTGMPDYYQGLNFDLDAQGDFMIWGAQNTDEPNGLYHAKMTWYRQAYRPAGQPAGFVFDDDVTINGNFHVGGLMSIDNAEPIRFGAYNWNGGTGGLLSSNNKNGIIFDSKGIALVYNGACVNVADILRKLGWDV